MTQTDDGGNAFPADETANQNGTMGMTLRDYFAVQALVPIIRICGSDPKRGDETHEQMFARKAYDCADAMLKARATQEGK